MRWFVGFIVVLALCQPATVDQPQTFYSPEVRAEVCECGPTCLCKEGVWNKDCRCKACKCDPVTAPIGEIAEPVKHDSFTGLVWAMAPFHCPPCETVKATVERMRAGGWDQNRLRTIDERGRVLWPGMWQPEAYPYCYVVIDGVPKRGHAGALTSHQMRDLWEKKPFGTNGPPVSAKAPTYRACRSCR